MPATTVTPTAALLIALLDLHRQRDEISAANRELDFATARVLGEQAIDYLEDIATAAANLLDGDLVLTIRIENAYATGEERVHHMVVALPAPADGEDSDDWAADHLLDFTGKGPDYAGIEAIYEVTVITCGQRPDLVGVGASAQG